jgi:hypothetical protein
MWTAAVFEGLIFVAGCTFRYYQVLFMGQLHPVEILMATSARLISVHRGRVRCGINVDGNFFPGPCTHEPFILMALKAVAVVLSPQRDSKADN